MHLPQTQNPTAPNDAVHGVLTFGIGGEVDHAARLTVNWPFAKRKQNKSFFFVNKKDAKKTLICWGFCKC